MVTFTLLKTFSIFFDVIDWLIIIRCFLSFIPMVYSIKIFRIIYEITEPILAPFRKLLFKSSFAKNIPIDFSPILAFLVIDYLIRPLVMYLIEII